MVKIFAHRGFAEKKDQQNTILAIDNAYKMGFDGVEIDIHYLNGSLLMTHDPVPKGQEKNLDNFDQFLKYQNKMLYWLDFKNLQDLDNIGLEQALTKVKLDIQNNNCNLENFYFAPYITDYKVAQRIFNKINEVFAYQAQLTFVVDDIKKDQYQELSQFLSKMRIENISIEHNLINEDFMSIFHDKNLFTWTVNEIAIAKELVAKYKIANFTTDNILPNQIVENSK